MDDDGGYFDENGEWWLDDFGITQDDADKIFDAIRVNEENLLKQTLAIMSVDNHSPSEYGLKVLKQYSSGEISYTQAIEKINKNCRESIPTLLH